MNKLAVTLLALLFVSGCFVMTSNAQVSLTTLNTPSTQSFDSLLTTGFDITFSNNVTIPGWYSNRPVYAGGHGAVTGAGSGTIWSYGTYSGSTERALGSVATNPVNSGTGTIYYGVRLKNNTGSVITSINVSFNGEQWRRANNANTHNLIFDYLQAPTVTDVTAAGYTSVATLNFASPIHTVGAATGLNGNLTANRAAKAATINVTIPIGEEIMLRWTDVFETGENHGLAIDDFSVTPQGPTALNGTISVGTGQSITSLTNAGGLFEQINSAGLSGNLNVNITSDLLSETGTVALNQIAESGGSNFSVTIQSSSGPRIISGDTSTPPMPRLALIPFNGGDRVTFNGANGTLFFRNTSASTGAVVRFINDSSSNTIANCIVEGGNTDELSALIFIGDATTTGNNSNTISNSTIRARTDVAGVPANLVFVNKEEGLPLNSGTTVTGSQLTDFTSVAIRGGTVDDFTATNENWTITNNDISQTADRTTAISGILINSVGTMAISGNAIHNLRSSFAAGQGLPSTTGIWLLGGSVATVTGNRIYDFSAFAGGTGQIIGIEFDGDPNVAGAIATVRNNFVSISTTASTNQSVIGIFDFGFSGNTFTAEHNSVYIGGTSGGTEPSWAILRGDLAPTNHTSRNNIAFNNRTGGGANHFAAGDQSATTGTFLSNFNFFAGTGTTAAHFMDYGSSPSGTPVSFAAWQAGPPTRDANSTAGIANTGVFTLSNIFVSATDLHAASSATNPASNAGTPIAGVTTDFDGETRSATTPDIGADEFSTPSLAPIVTTNTASPVGTTTATLNGTANPGGAETTGWFRFSTVNPGTCNDSFGTRAPAMGGSPLGSGNGNAGYSQGITGLAPGVAYFFCAIASNSVGTSFGSVLQFTTLAVAPSVTTQAATSVTSGGATLNGSANPNGAATTSWFRYSTTDPVMCSDTFGIRVPGTDGTALGSGTTPVGYSQVLAGLTPGTKYYFCAIAGNSVGTSFGTVLNFTTAVNAPIVTTNTASPVGTTTATLNGSANPGGAEATGWFRYSTVNPVTCNDMFGTRAPGMGGSPLGSGNGNAGFSQGIAGLTPGTTYYFCAIASNSVGTSFGAVVSLTTGIDPDGTPPVLTYTPIPNTTSTSNPTLSVMITDAVGITGSTIFFSIDGGSYASNACSLSGGTAQDGTWNCTITATLTNPSAIAYYVTAQDAAANTASNPGEGVAAPNLFTIGGGVVPGGTYSNVGLSDGASLGGNVGVIQVLTLGGIIDTGSNMFTVGCNATIVGQGSGNFIAGTVKKEFCATGLFTFPVGTLGDGIYSPVLANITAGNLPGSSLTVTPFNDVLQGFDSNRSISRYWSLEEAGSIIADLSFQYSQADIGGAEADYRVFRVAANGTPSDQCTAGPCVDTTNHIGGPVFNVADFSRWTVAQPFVVTAGEVSISGRVQTSAGRGIRNAIVEISGGGLTLPRRIATGTMGYYRFDDLPAGSTYILSVNARRFTFLIPSRVVSLNDNFINADFVAEP